MQSPVDHTSNRQFITKIIRQPTLKTGRSSLKLTILVDKRILFIFMSIILPQLQP
jgi:hypothetical protein